MSLYKECDHCEDGQIMICPNCGTEHDINEVNCVECNEELKQGDCSICEGTNKQLKHLEHDEY